MIKVKIGADIRYGKTYDNRAISYCDHLQSLTLNSFM